MQLKLLGGVVVFGLVAMGVQKINHAVNYTPVTASISSVSSTCNLEKVDSGTTYTTDDMPCQLAEMLKASGGEYAGSTVEGTVETSFTYTSPADQSRQTGTLKYSYEKYGRLAALSSGAQLPILAHESDPDSVARDDDRMDSFARAQ